MFIALNFPNSPMATYIWILTPLSLFGRVYFQCHWIGDTIIGMAYGALFVYLNTLIEEAVLGQRFVVQ